MCVCPLTGDLLSGLLGRGVCVWGYSDPQPAFGSCSVCTVTGDLHLGLVGIAMCVCVL